MTGKPHNGPDAIIRAVNARFNSAALSKANTSFLTELGVRLAPDLAKVSLEQFMATGRNLPSKGASPHLMILSWMALRGYYSCLSDIQPAKAFPTIIRDAGFTNDLRDRLLAIGFRRLEMLTLFSAKDLEKVEALRDHIDTIRAVLAANHLRLRDE